VDFKLQFAFPFFKDFNLKYKGLASAIIKANVNFIYRNVQAIESSL
jgi:hypothetical protein